MATVGEVEDQIMEVEGLRVVILNQDGRNARSDMQGLQEWPFQKASKGSWTIAEWEEKFEEVYPSLSVAVVDQTGTPYYRNTLIGNVRLDLNP
ncbi:hypothetical protein [Halorhodospira halochloris]|uniref:hypothetical protein n=1 Tax=Halorhodospira halochloris TaxID=1052 RepID=UPI001EE7B131|nr:hypothetical protein [Halorhodospira halochloris]MCG5549577.1 hypothetical protein [Halorhodospira halochloris]